MMEKSSPRPTLFTARGLELTTKGIVIYAAFSSVIAISKIVSDKINMNALMPTNVLYPMYALLGVYLMVIGVNAICILKKRFFWIVAIVSIALLLACRFYYIEVANWMYAQEF